MGEPLNMCELTAEERRVDRALAPRAAVSPGIG